MATMLALAAPKFTPPSGYTTISLPIPTISSPTDVLVRIKAASINPVDVGRAAGKTNFAEHLQLPVGLGIDFSGVVVEVGEEVTEFKKDDEVFGMRHLPGTVAEYAIIPAQFMVKKPEACTFVQAAALGTVGLTALQAFSDAEEALEGGLRGKTVMIPAALGGTGHIAILLAKKVFGVGRVITTASPGKIPRLEQLLGEGVVDQVVDYTKENPAKVVPAESVDFLYDTLGHTLRLLPVVKRGGVVMSIAAMMSGKQAKGQIPSAPWIVVAVLNLLHWYFRWRARRRGVEYRFIFPLAENRHEHLRRLSEMVTEAGVKPVIGRTHYLKDLHGVKDACAEIYNGKGGVGKFVVIID